MSSPTFNLNQFIKSVPVCSTDAKLDILWELFSSSQKDLIIVVNQQQCPQGIISLSRVLPYLQHDQFNWSTQLNHPHPGFDCESVIEPILIVNNQLGLQNLVERLQTWQIANQGSSHCAVVNSQGQLIGLLDPWLLLNYALPLVTNAQKHTTTPLTQNNSLHLEPYYWQESTSIVGHPLVQLIEQLPLPLRLETDSGQVISQNFNWRSQIDNLEEAQTLKTIEPNPALINSPAKVNAFCSTKPQQDESYLPTELAIQPCCQTSRQIIPTRLSLTEFQHQLSAINQHLSPWESPQSPTKPKRTWRLMRIPLHDQKLIQFSGQSTYPKFNQQSPLWLVLATDVTEHEQLCKELAAKNADLVQLNRLKDEFLACISHELKSPLTAVVGLSSLLKDQSLGKLNQRQSRYAGLIYQSGHHLMTLVNDILDLTRLETGQLQLTSEPIRLETVCERAYQQALQLQSFREQNKSEFDHGTEFRLEIEPNLEMMIADELRLRQMLVHLLDNALKFTEAEGEVGLRVSRWEGWIAFNVWDTGVGIPAALQHLIFQKFQQLENPLTRKFEGTGLGLVLTQRLARAHGGDVSFTSKVGQGSQFTLLLPPSPAHQEHDNIWEQPEADDYDGNIEQFRDHPSTLQPKVTNRLVLVVEAVPRYIENVTEQLRELGYRVVIARSGTEALEKARQLQPCMILLNPLLPLLSGWDVLILIKSDPKTSKIPVLVTATRGEKLKAEQNGADGFLSLPVAKQELSYSLTSLGESLHTNNKKLTILRLSDQTFSHSPLTSLDLALSSHLSELKYRILEAQDPEQAEIIARVWHPDVVLLDGFSLADPVAYLNNFSQQPYLAALPLITLEKKTTQAANQIANLSVFPCLVANHEQGVEAILEVIKIAAGMGSQPHLLVYGYGMNNTQQLTKYNLQNYLGSSSSTEEQKWLQALIQYLQTAGFRSSLSHSWQEVNSQLQYCSVDLLLLYLNDLKNDWGFIEQLQSLNEMANKPPVLILDRRSNPQNTSEEIQVELDKLLNNIATTVVRDHNQSMSDLLKQINLVVNY